MRHVTVSNDQEGKLCPIKNVLSKVMGKWQCLILLPLEDGAVRFGGIKRQIGDITQRVLTENLRSLERDGYLTRTVHPGPPVAVFYELADLGKGLIALMKPLLSWAASRFEQVTASRTKFDG